MPNPLTVPLMPDGTLPPLAFLLRWLEHARRAGANAVRLERLSHGNGSLPDVLALAGIGSVELADRPATAFLWEGCGGSQVLVNPGAIQGGTPALHHGHLPVCAPLDAAGPFIACAWLETARSSDAASLRGSDGVDWSAMTTAAPGGAAYETLKPPIPTQALVVANPLPCTRVVVATLPGPFSSPLRGFSDQGGAQWPAQVVEQNGQREHLTVIRLAALEQSRLTPLDQPIAGCHWEVSTAVLDNGRVRAEIDGTGGVSRLCCDGDFAALVAPAVIPQVDGHQLAGASDIRVIEEGPVRARVTVRRSGLDGELTVSYTLHAHEALLRVEARWTGRGELRLSHPTAHHAGDLRLGGDLAAWRMAQAACVGGTPKGPQSGVRWAVLGDAGGRGLALVAAHPLKVSALTGNLCVHGNAAAYALGVIADSDRPAGLAQLSEELAAPAHRLNGDDAPPPLRFDGAGLIPRWVRRPADWNGELTLSEPVGRCGRALLIVTGAREAARVDCCGKLLAALPRTAEGDGFDIDFRAHEVLIVRWR